MCCLKWDTPFLRQCFVTSGVALNMASQSFVVVYASVLLPQLQRPDSIVVINQESGSWLASVVALSQIAGICATPFIGSKFGGKIVGITSIAILIMGWIFVIMADNITLLMVGRISQGIATGLFALPGPVLVGEYCSPKYRGLFIAATTMMMSLAPLLLQTLGAFLSWQMTGFIALVMKFLNLIIVIYSPESPTWLIDKGKYEQGKKIYRWLRGNDEEDELLKMIEVNLILNKDKNSKVPFLKQMHNVIYDSIEMLKRKEFYKPVFITVHMFAIAHIGGLHSVSTYVHETTNFVVGSGTTPEIIAIGISAIRFVSNLIAIYTMRRTRRRIVLLISCTSCIAMNFVIAGYYYLKVTNMIDSSFIGIILLLMLMTSIGMGVFPLTYTLSGELLPLKYKGVCGSITAFSAAMFIFAVVKTYTYLLNTIQLHGTFVLYGVVISYCFIVIWYNIPETKDRTLQDIEDEFRGYSLQSKEVLKPLNKTTSEAMDGE